MLIETKPFKPFDPYMAIQRIFIYREEMIYISVHINQTYIYRYIRCLLNLETLADLCIFIYIRCALKFQGKYGDTHAYTTQYPNDDCRGYLYVCEVAATCSILFQLQYTYCYILLLTVAKGKKDVLVWEKMNWFFFSFYFCQFVSFFGTFFLFIRLRERELMICHNKPI